MLHFKRLPTLKRFESPMHARTMLNHEMMLRFTLLLPPVFLANTVHEFEGPISLEFRGLPGCDDALDYDRQVVRRRFIGALRGDTVHHHRVSRVGNAARFGQYASRSRGLDSLPRDLPGQKNTWRPTEIRPNGVLRPDDGRDHLCRALVRPFVLWDHKASPTLFGIIIGNLGLPWILLTKKPSFSMRTTGRS